MSTIKDVARIAGVTPTTVSRVLNNRGYISNKTRFKVQDAMRQLNYQPNSIARSLQRKRSDLVAILVPDSSSPFYTGLIHEVERQCYKIGKKLILCNSMTDPQLEHDYISILNGQNVDGLIICSHNIDIGEYENLPFMTVSFDRIIPHTPLVASENFNGGKIAAEHLVNRGAKHLLHISGPMTKTTLVGHDRYKGFAAYCTSHGVPFDLMQTKDNLLYDYYFSFVEREIADKIFDYDGVFCSNDILAYALFRYAVKRGVEVPQQLKIVGFDNSVFTRMLDFPKLTTIAQDERSIAKKLIEKLFSEDKTATYIPVRLIEGETT